jgi:hypothetical protein
MGNRKGPRIDNVGGDVIGAGVSGDGNVIGKNIHVSGTITVNKERLNAAPKELADSLRAFSDAVNEQIKKHNVPAEAVAPVEDQINELAAEVEDVDEPETVGYVKKQSIKARLAAVAKGVLKLLPKTAEVGAAFTPLAPFSKIIGEGVADMVKAIEREV